jgi:dimeric dUTPase (all-alpha-NTP-PPase superfamily)
MEKYFMEDNLRKMFKLREEFMKEIQAKYPSSYPEWPVDVSKKRSQKALRETALKGVEEMFEALQHLKNWKTHKQKGSVDFDRPEFLEEMVDAFNYFFAMFIMLGVTPDEFMNAYETKNKKIHQRLKGTY